MLFLVLGCSGATFSGKSSDDDEEDSSGNDDDAEELECGWNAEPDHGDCVCVEPYDWCDSNQEHCCAWWTDDFRVVLLEAVTMPTKPTDEPWDWDGDVPDWIIEVCEAVGTVSPEAQTAAELLEIVDEYGPVLLEGTTPPDPYVYGFHYWGASTDDFEELGYLTDTDTDTITPFWNYYLDVEILAPDEEVYFEVWDEDLVSDDYVGTAVLTSADFRYFAGYQLTLPAEFLYDDLFEFTVVIEPR